MCEVCARQVDIFNFLMPNTWITVMLCEQCHELGRFPLWALLETTVRIGGMYHADTLWFEMVHASLPFFGITCEEFDDMVEDQIRGRYR